MTLRRSQDEAKIGPRSPQDGLKTSPKGYRFKRRFYDRFWVVLGSVLVPSWPVLGPQGAVLGPSWRPLGVPRRSQNRSLAGRDLGRCWLGTVYRFQDRSRPPQDRPRRPKDPPKRSQEPPKTTQNGQHRPPRRPKTTKNESTKRPKTTNTQRNTTERPTQHR